MTLRLTDEETAALRRQAELEGRSMQDIAHRSVAEYIARHSRAIEREALLREAVDEHGELLERLRDS